MAARIKKNAKRPTPAANTAEAGKKGPAFAIKDALAEAGGMRGPFKLATAESCTGGLLASTITDVPGSSEYFMGSVVAYDNSVKKNILRVKATTIKDYGAVSAETAVEMAEGVLVRMRADVAVAVTGIAGPGGGTPEKPVGTVFICVAGRDGALIRGCSFTGSRRSIKRQTVEHSIDALLEFLSGTRA